LLEREQISDERVADEERRHSNMLAKTARLREQRLARDAAEEKTAKSEANPKRPGSGVRLRKGGA
jgi:rubrerythrin